MKATVCILAALCLVGVLTLVSVSPANGREIHRAVRNFLQEAGDNHRVKRNPQELDKANCTTICADEDDKGDECDDICDWLSWFCCDDSSESSKTKCTTDCNFISKTTTAPQTNKTEVVPPDGGNQPDDGGN